MLFNSWEFLIFLPVVVSFFFFLKHEYRWGWLLAASCFFYMFFKPVYILILGFTIFIDYYAGILIERTTDKILKKRYLLLSISANIGILAFFKYYNFLNQNISGIASLFHLKNEIPFLVMMLPIGLSFHTFQAMSYTLEVYRGNQKAEKHLGIYALYVMFFPQLVAGPIERPQNILPQFHTKQYFKYKNAIAGLKLISFGLFKKIVIADRLAVYVNKVYGDPVHASSVAVVLAVVFALIQIYADFSGYSDIARGSAKIMGYDLLINFNKPFTSTSVSEFWRRWHISLSTWLKDYLFAPLISACWDLKKAGIAIALLITFCFSGLWHGAGWNYILFGLVNGLAVVYELYTRNLRKKVFSVFPVQIQKVLSKCIVWIFLALSLVLFRAENISKANQVWMKILNFRPQVNFNELYAGTGPIGFALTLLSLIVYIFLIKIQIQNTDRRNFIFILLTILFILFIGQKDTNEFIYFQF